MGMTENEAKEYGENYLRDLTVAVCKVEEKHKNFVRMAIQALSEIQQYRAIGTVEEIQSIKDQLLMVKDMCKDYYEIGTIDELQALKEKNEPKKADEEYCCPICHTCGMDDDGIAGAYCTECGQKLDWSE